MHRDSWDEEGERPLDAGDAETRPQWLSTTRME
ncbi:hypothetical protein [Caballeronia temeraria]